VLVVDDDPEAVEALCCLLAMDGYHVRGASSGTAAKAMLDAEPFDAVVTDLEMPGVGGLEVVAAAKGARVVVVTAGDDPADRLRAEQLGARKVFGKPVEYEELASELSAP